MHIVIVFLMLLSFSHTFLLPTSIIHGARRQKSRLVRNCISLDAIPFSTGRRFEVMSENELRQHLRPYGVNTQKMTKPDMLKECFRLSDSSSSTSSSSQQDPSLVFSNRYDTESLSQTRMTSRMKSNSNKPRAATTPLRFPTGENRNIRLEDVSATDMSITFFGTASCIPCVTRGVNSVALRYLSDTWVFDVGEGTQVKIQQSVIKPSRIRKIFITHLHGDHSFGLPGFLCLLGQAAMEERTGTGGGTIEPIDVYGPEGIRDLIRATLQLTYSRIAIPHRIHELKNVTYLHNYQFGKSNAPVIKRINAPFDPVYGERDGGLDIYPDKDGVYNLCSEEKLEAFAVSIQHTVPCVGFVVQEKDRLGALKVDTLQPIVERNKAGLNAISDYANNYRAVYKDIKALGVNDLMRFPDGTIVYGKDVNEPTVRGRKIVILGDNCDASNIIPIGKKADVLIHEATNCYLPEMDVGKTAESVERDTMNHGHSTPQMAGALAHKLEAKKLLLSHFSLRYLGDSSENSMKTMWRIEDLARRRATRLTAPNDIIAAWDLMTINLPFRPDDNSDK